MDTVELIVECVLDEAQENKIRKMGNIKYHLPMINSYVIEIPSNMVAQLKGIQGVNSIAHNASITAQMDRTRKVVNMSTEERQGFQYTGKGVSIAILDTGVAPVDDLCVPQNRLIAFKDFVNGENKPYDDNAHGTHVTYSSSHRLTIF